MEKAVRHASHAGRDLDITIVHTSSQWQHFTDYEIAISKGEVRVETKGDFRQYDVSLAQQVWATLRKYEAAEIEHNRREAEERRAKR